MNKNWTGVKLDLNGTVAQGFSYIDQAAKNGARLIAFPEVCARLLRLPGCRCTEPPKLTPFSSFLRRSGSLDTQRYAVCVIVAIPSS
jgi:predicted amidohydrolase